MLNFALDFDFLAHSPAPPPTIREIMSFFAFVFLIPNPHMDTRPSRIIIAVDVNALAYCIRIMNPQIVFLPLTDHL